MLSCSTVLLLALFQAAKPSPRGSSADPSYASRDVKQQGQHDYDATRPALALAEPVQPNPAEVQRDQKASYDSQNGIKLTSLPPVTIADKKKTAWDHVFDWGPWVCNLFLVIVGFLQVMLLRQTREEMHRQAKDAREQQRAKLEVLFPPPSPILPQAKGSPEDMVGLSGLNVRVANYGYTEAFKVVAKGTIFASKDVKQDAAAESRLNVKSVIKRMANPETVETTDAVTLTFAREGYLPALSRKDLDSVLSKTSQLRILGVVEYVDVYNITHKSPFDFVWVIAEIVENGVRIDKSQWLNQSKSTT